MRTDTLDVQEALCRGKALPYALVHHLSGVTLGPAPETLELDELIEARFFGEQQEVRLFRDETGLRAVCLTREEGDVTIQKRYKLANKSRFGELLTIEQVLDFDKEDGQAFISCTRLTGWKGGKQDAH